MNHKIINSFDDIDRQYLKIGCLVILDIDETILKYSGINKKWHMDKYNHYYSLYRDHELAEDLHIKDWRKHVETTLPTLTDKSFFSLLETTKLNKCNIIFVTARDEFMRDITYKHLAYVGIDKNIFENNIYFTAGNDKSYAIEKVTKTKKYDKYIFVDDMETNLDKVKKKFGDKVVCYRFEL